MTPQEVNTETKGRCKTCHGLYERDPYAPCNLHPETEYPCGGACHTKRGIMGEFEGFCGPLVFDPVQDAVAAERKRMIRVLEAELKVAERSADEYERERQLDVARQYDAKITLLHKMLAELFDLLDGREVASHGE